MSSKERFIARNKAVRKFFDDLADKHPFWKQKHIIEQTAGHYFLAIRTTEAIINREGIYAD